MHEIQSKFRIPVGYAKTLNLLLQLLWHASRSLFLCLLGLTVLTGIISPLLLLFNAALIDSIVQSFSIAQPPPSTLQRIILLLVLLGGLSALGQIIAILRTSVKNMYQKRVTNHISMLIATKASTLDLAFFENSEFHNLLTNATAEASYRSVTIILQLFTALSTCVTLFSISAILLTWQVWITPVILLFSLIRFWVLAYFGKALVKLEIEQTPMTCRAQYFNSLLTSDFSAKEVRLFSLSAFLLERYQHFLNHVYQRQRQFIHRQTLASTLIELALSALRPLLIAFAVLQCLEHVISLGQFTLYVQAIFQVETNLFSLLSGLAQFHQDMLFVTNLFRFLQLELEIEQSSFYISSATSQIQQLHGTCTPHIEFRHVSFCYPGTDITIIDDLNLHIYPGEAVALVGENGAGKTTFVKLLTGLYRPTAGQILLNNIDITTLDRKDLRALLSVIFQDYSLYHFSAYDNIGVGQVDQLDNRARVEVAAQRSGLAPIIESLPEKYETTLGRWFERGHELSGGQRQLVALARAMMRNTPILILDEPSAALDIEKELDFFQRLLSEHKMRNQTVIFISHRFSTVRRADRILVLER